jgi:hypothetical protein
MALFMGDLFSKEMAMVNHVELDARMHRNLHVVAGPHARYGNAVPFVGIIPAEFARIAAHHAIFLRRNSQSGQLEPGAMLGFKAGENLFLAPRGWATPCVPLEFQRQPFMMIAGAEGQLSLAIDTDCPRVQAESGERLFLSGGHATDYLERMRVLVAQYCDGVPAAHAYGRMLGELGLVEPAQLDIRFGDGSETRIDGLHAINRDRFDALDDAAIVRLQRAGWLELIHIQLASLAQVSNLIARRDGTFG